MQLFWNCALEKTDLDFSLDIYEKQQPEIASSDLAYYKRKKEKKKEENTAQMQFWYMKTYEYYNFGISEECAFVINLHTENFNEEGCQHNTLLQIKKKKSMLMAYSILESSAKLVISWLEKRTGQLSGLGVSVQCWHGGCL